MNFASRDPMSHPGIHSSAEGVLEQPGGGGGRGHGQENAEHGRCAFFPWPLTVRRDVLFSWCQQKLVVSERSTRTVMRYMLFGCSVIEDNLIDLLWPRKRPRHRRRLLLLQDLSLSLILSREALC